MKSPRAAPTAFRESRSLSLGQGVPPLPRLGWSLAPDHDVPLPGVRNPQRVRTEMPGRNDVQDRRQEHEPDSGRPPSASSGRPAHSFVGFVAFEGRGVLGGRRLVGGEVEDLFRARGIRPPGRRPSHHQPRSTCVAERWRTRSPASGPRSPHPPRPTERAGLRREACRNRPRRSRRVSVPLTSFPSVLPIEDRTYEQHDTGSPRLDEAEVPFGAYLADVLIHVQTRPASTIDELRTTGVRSPFMQIRRE